MWFVTCFWFEVDGCSFDDVDSVGVSHEGVEPWSVSWNDVFGVVVGNVKVFVLECCSFCSESFIESCFVEDDFFFCEGESCDVRVEFSLNHDGFIVGVFCF